MNRRLVNPAELAEWLIEIVGSADSFKKYAVRTGVLGSLNRDSLADFFDFDCACGVYIGGGQYLDNGMEEVTAALVIGVRNVSDKTAALGTGEDVGAWQLLHAAKTAISAARAVGTNISDIRPQKWRDLLVRADIALIGLDVKITLHEPPARRCESGIFDF